MKFIDHGDWVLYQSEVQVPTILGNVLFCKRKQDGRDWYDLLQELRDNKASVKITLMHVGDNWMVTSTQRDASMLFPQNCKVIEIDYDGDHEKLRQQRFDPASGEFTPIAVEQPATQE